MDLAGSERVHITGATGRGLHAFDEAAMHTMPAPCILRQIYSYLTCCSSDMDVSHRRAQLPQKCGGGQ